MPFKLNLNRKTKNRVFLISIGICLLALLATIILLIIVIVFPPDSGNLAGESPNTVFQPVSSQKSTESVPENPNSNLPWNLTLVNRHYPLEEGYVPETAAISNGMEFDVRAIDQLRALLRDSNQEGLDLIVCSGYRSVDYQTQLFEEKVNSVMASGATHDEAVAAAQQEVLPPGTSEHNLGLAVDIVCLEYQNLDEGYAETDAAKWLVNHAAEYGFILPYPKDKEAITGVVFEPWHYRYVGQEAAEEIMRLGITLEEYLGRA